MPKDLKIMVIGDSAVGKSSLLISFSTNFPTTHIPTVFDNYSANLIVDGSAINLGLWDCAGAPDFATLRPLSYAGTDVFLICFSLIDCDSYDNVTEKWLPEIANENLSHVPVIIVGTKLDIRDDDDEVRKLAKRGIDVVTNEMGVELKEKINAFDYIECSALTQVNIHEVFEQCVRAVIPPTVVKEEPKVVEPPPSRGRCLIQ